MSYTAIHQTTKDGQVTTLAEIPNAMRGALAVWDILGKFKLYGRSPWWNAVVDAPEVWELFSTPRLNRMERLVLGSTFDKVMVKRENLEELAREFEEFTSRYNPVGSRALSLSEQAKVLSTAAKDESTFAVFWTQTSVSFDVWHVYDGEGDWRYYDITKDTGHFFLFEEVDKVEKAIRTKP